MAPTAPRLLLLLLLALLLPLAAAQSAAGSATGSTTGSATRSANGSTTGSANGSATGPATRSSNGSATGSATGSASASALANGSASASALTTSSASASGTCAAAALTLSDACGGVCGAYEPCLAYNASATCPGCTAASDGACQFECFPAEAENEGGAIGTTYFVLLVTFGEYQSEEEIAARAANPAYDSNLAKLPDNRTDFAWVSNDQLSKVDALNVSVDAAYFVLAGGPTFEYVLKSKVVQLELAPDLLASQTQLVDIRLASINMKETIAGLPAMLPRSVLSLNLGNTLLSSFPNNLEETASLEELYLNSNYISSVESTDGIAQLLVLAMRNNEMTSFQGNFPLLTSLDLSYNNLTEIPEVIFSFSNLQSLYLTANLLGTPTLTTAQADFLSRLTTLDLTAADFRRQVTCEAAARRRVHSLSVCISDSSSSSGSGSSSSTDTSEGSGSSTTTIVIAVVVGVVVIAVAVVGLVYWRKRQNAAGKGEEDTSTLPTGRSAHAKSSIVASIWTDADLVSLQVQLSEIQDIRVIGSGAFSLVFLVRYRGSQLLASKRLRSEMATRERTQEFIAEIKLVSKLEHPNIVRFVGAAWSIEADLQALFEYMENGDLRTYLSTASLPLYWTSTKFQLAIDVAEALVYVHSFRPPLVHRDLKSRNVLISADMAAKLTDFGVSRFQSQENTMTLGVGTSRWLAPEVIAGASDYGPPADLFSLGVVLSELDTHALPYDGAVGANGHRLQDVAILQMVASGQLRPAFSRSCPPTVLELAQLCMSQDPSARPSAAEVAFVLRSIQKEMFRQ